MSGRRITVASVFTRSNLGPTQEDMASSLPFSSDDDGRAAVSVNVGSQLWIQCVSGRLSNADGQLSLNIFHSHQHRSFFSPAPAYVIHSGYSFQRESTIGG